MNTFLASVDLGGTNIAAALGTADGRVVCELKAPTASHEGPDGVLRRIGDAVETLAARAGARPAALGMAVPGLVDQAAGETRFLPNFPTQWRGVTVVTTLAGRLGCPVRLLNDVRTATLGELTYGHGRGAGTMVFLALGTGVGGGIAIDGKLRLGPLGAAGEMGHQTILENGPLCGCGNRGCLETLASGPALAGEGVRLVLGGLAPKLRDLVRGDLNAISSATMGEAARQGDANVARAIERAAGWLGIGVANVVTTLHPDLVVLGGGVAELGDLLLEPVRRAVRERVGMFPTDGVRVERSLLGDRAGLLGGLALAAGAPG